MKKTYIVPQIEIEEILSDEYMLTGSTDPKPILTVDHTEDPNEDSWNQPGFVGSLDEETTPTDGISDWEDGGW